MTRDSARCNSTLRLDARIACLLLLALGIAAAAIAAPPAFAPDKGKFKILVNGQPAGTEEFSLSANGGNWTAHGNAEIQTPQGVAHVTGNLELRPDGAPVRYEWKIPLAKLGVMPGKAGQFQMAITHSGLDWPSTLNVDASMHAVFEAGEPSWGALKADTWL